MPFFLKEVRNATEAHIALMRGSPYVPKTLQMQLRRINLFFENNFIYSLGLGRDNIFDCGFIRRLLFQGKLQNFCLIYFYLLEYHLIAFI
jgi:hypothetical protein